MVITGGCHCGNTSSNSAGAEPTEIPARGVRLLVLHQAPRGLDLNPGGVLRVTVDDPSLVSSYFFGTRTARFHVCARCGVVPW